MNAKTVLLVDDGKPQILKSHRLLKQGVGADDDLRRARSDCRQRFRPRRALVPPCEQRDLDARSPRQRFKPGEVLPGENIGRGHQRGLSPGLDGAGHGEQRDDRFA